MSTYRLLCLICDSKNGTLRRVRPYELYVCEPCVKAHGPMSAIQGRAPEYVAGFTTRHDGKVR